MFLDKIFQAKQDSDTPSEEELMMSEVPAEAVELTDEELDEVAGGWGRRHHGYHKRHYYHKPHYHKRHYHKRHYHHKKYYHKKHYYRRCWW